MGHGVSLENLRHYYKTHRRPGSTSLPLEAAAVEAPAETDHSIVAGSVGSAALGTERTQVPTNNKPSSICAAHRAAGEPVPEYYL